MIYILYIGIFCISFLVVLNGLLQGRLKSRIDAILSISIVSLIVCIFALFGWKFGIVSIVTAFFATIITRPIALIVARKILKPNVGFSSILGTPNKFRKLQLKISPHIDSNEVIPPLYMVATNWKRKNFKKLTPLQT